MKSTLFEHYKQKYKVGGTKVPVKKTGMWYQSGDVVVPSNNITMKGPKGEPDYFNNPILGTGVDTGATQIMQPGKDYNFPNDTAVYETKMKNGGQMIKRADGSYSRRGLWDNIRANKGSGKRPTKEMLQQERKIKAKMQDGGSVADLALDAASFVPGPIGMGASAIGFAKNLYEGDYWGAGLDAVNVLSGGLGKVFTKASTLANAANMGRKARSMTRAANLFKAGSNPNIYKGIAVARDYANTDSGANTSFGGYSDNTRIQPLAPIIKPKVKLQSGGGITSLPNELTQNMIPLNQYMGLTSAYNPMLNQYLSSTDKAKQEQEKFAYKTPTKTASNQSLFPKGVNVNSKVLNVAKELKNIPAEKQMDYVGDLSSKVSKAFQSPVDYTLDKKLPSGLGSFNVSGSLFDPSHRDINYNLNTNMPHGLGNVSISGSYNPNETLDVENLYKKMNYNLPRGNSYLQLNPQEQSLALLKNKGNDKVGLIYNRVSSKEGFNTAPAEQSLQLKSSSSDLTYRQMMEDGEKLNSLDFNTRISPQFGFNIGTEYNSPNGTGRLDPLSSNIPAYTANAGVVGKSGPVNYNVQGNYNPDTGYSYEGKAGVSLLNRALNLKGHVSGNQIEGIDKYGVSGNVNLLNNNLQISGNLEGNQKNAIDTYGVEAKAKLFKDLNLQAAYKKDNSNNPAQFTAGISYNKTFQMGGGMSIPGVNGSVVGSTGGSVREAYKKRKKK